MKRIRRRTRNKLIAVASTLAVLALGVFIVSVVNKAGYAEEIDNFLGGAESYGIVANTFEQGAHVDSNFAVVNYSSDKNFDNDKYTNIPGSVVVGEINGRLFPSYDGAYVVVGEGSESKVTNERKITVETVSKENISKFVSELISNTKAYALSVVDKSNYELPNEGDQNNFVIDVSAPIKVPVKKSTMVPMETVVPDEAASGSGSKVVAYQEKVEYTEYEEQDAPKVIYIQGIEKLYKDNKVSNYGLSIKKRKDQTVVFNYSGTGKFTVPSYHVYTVDGDANFDEIGATVIWNLPNAEKVVCQCDWGHSACTVIAPSATVTTAATCQGWIVCDTFSNTDEWHMISKKIPEPTPFNKEEPTATPEAEKTNEPTASPEVKKTAEPTKTPEVKKTTEPTATPEVKNTPEPTKTPEVKKTPEPTATPEPEKTPETGKETPTPVVTPTPEVTPEAEVTPTPSSTPEVTVTPAPTSTPSVVITPAPTSTPSIVVPPSSTSTPAPEVTNAPTETPLTVVDEDVPLGPASPEEEVTEVPEEDVPLSNFNAPTKPKKDTTTVIEEDVPLAATVPETGDSMNPMVPLAGMGLSLIAIAGVVVIRKKKLIK